MRGVSFTTGVDGVVIEVGSELVFVVGSLGVNGEVGINAGVEITAD